MDVCAFLRSPLAGLLIRRRFDRLAVPALARLYFPVSRLWAMALAAGGDPERLVEAIPGLARKRARLARALDRLARRERAHAAAAAAWERALFGGADVPEGALAAIEDRRVGAAQALMAARIALMPLRRAAALDPFGWDIPGPDEVRRLRGARLAGPGAAFPVPAALPAVARSRAIETSAVRTFWVRCPSAVGGAPDTLWARVEAPARAGPCPAIVFAHGIAMETEFWRDSGGPAPRLAAAGIAVVRPEGPYHGRRRLPGTFGGEPALARGTLGMLDYFEAHARELAILTAWAREAFGGPVAVGGVSLGALTAQMAVSAARHWPAAMRPDAALLVTTSGAMMPVAMESSLTRAIAMPQRMAEAGWDRERLAEWMPLLEPVGAPAVAPGRIVALLGTEDDVTPYAEGRRLMERWGVPADNVFVRPLGHFSAALGLYRDIGPLRRLAALLGAPLA